MINLKSMNPSDREHAYTRFVSHQLKSPIHAIQSLLKTITEGYAGEVPPQAQQAVEKALARALEAEDTVTAMLEYEQYSKVNPEEFREIDLIPIMESLGISFAVAASEKEISFKTDFPSDRKLILRGDEKTLEHAFRNLLENAVKYTPSLGSIRFSLRIDQENSMLHISVSDTGEGIPEKEIDNLFTPFFRASIHKNRFPGTGLGLSIVKKLIENHGGEITVQSREKEGTTFTASLPFIRQEIAEGPLKHRKRVVIIGGVTSGPKAAARLRRLNEEIDITLVEQNESLSYTGCELPHFISGRLESSRQLLSTPFHRIRNAQYFETFKHITALNNRKAVEIDRERKELKIEDPSKGTRITLPFDQLILATGTIPFIPDIPGIRGSKVFTVYSLENAKRLRKRLEEKEVQEVFILGCGLIGASIAQSIMETGARVTILEKEERILKNYLDRDMARKLETLFSRKGIKVLTEVTVTKIVETESGVQIHTSGGRHRADFIVLSAGVRPNTELAQKAGLAIAPSGGIEINQRMQTSDEDIYAVGDCAESPHHLTGRHEYWPLGSVSTKMGRIAADVIAGRDSTFNGSLGTTLFTCFDLQVGRTGLTLERAREEGRAVESVVVTGTDKPEYRPDSEYIFFKLLADRATGQILGAQALGRGLVSSKIALMAAAVTNSMTLEEFFNLDLGYAPEFTTPIDITQTACAVLRNKIDGLIRTVTGEEVSSSANLLAVTPVPGNSPYIIPGSLQIAPDRLRNEELTFEKGDEIVLYCKTSSLAYQAYRYLESEGYLSVRVLEGGYLFWE